MVMVDIIKKIFVDLIFLVDGCVLFVEINFWCVDDNKFLLSFSVEICLFNFVMLFICGFFL